MLQQQEKIIEEVNKKKKKKKKRKIYAGNLDHLCYTRQEKINEVPF